MPDSGSERLKGRRLLVVEDEYLIAADLTASLESVGVEVIGPAASVEEALLLVEKQCSTSILELSVYTRLRTRSRLVACPSSLLPATTRLRYLRPMLARFVVRSPSTNRSLSSAWRIQHGHGPLHNLLISACNSITFPRNSNSNRNMQFGGQLSLHAPIDQGRSLLSCVPTVWSGGNTACRRRPLHAQG
jgi:hypothetical protein